MTDQQRELELLQQENAQLKQALEQEKVRSMNFAREAFLVDLLGKHQLTGKEYRQSLRELELNFPTPWFAVILIQVEPDIPALLGPKAAISQESLRYVRFLVRNVLEELIGEKHICHVVTVQGQLTALVNLSEGTEAAMDTVEQAAQRAASLFESHYDSAVLFSISRCHQGYQQIHEAYQEAESLMQYRIMAEDDASVIRYDQKTEVHMEKRRVEHFEFEHELDNYIRQGDYEAARELVHRMLGAEFGHAKPTVQVFMIRAYGLINDILHVFDSLEEYFSPEFLVELQAGPRIVHATSLAEISRELDSIFDEIIRRQQSQEQEPGWVQRAVEYMDHHYSDQNLNVAGVADAVGINPVYLSRMLKKYRNIRPLEYIHQKRIERAKQLLGQGVTVKDTLPQVGYSSALTMNRAFRKFEDATPGAFYREKQS